MAHRPFHPDGTPNLSIEEIEDQIERLKGENTRTELWMGARSRTAMRRFEEKDKSLRYAYEAGYRAGSETNWWIFVALIGLFLLLTAGKYLFG